MTTVSVIGNNSGWWNGWLQELEKGVWQVCSAWSEDHIGQVSE
jgi:hypothetical protein